MKAVYQVNPKLSVELDAPKQKDLFKALASAQEVFGEKRCGLCGCTDIIPVWRTVTTIKGKKTETHEFPEYHCQGLIKDEQTGKQARCGARLAMGTINDDTGTIYPTRKLKENGQPLTKEERDKGVEGKYGRHNGWHRFEKKTEQAK